MDEEQALNLYKLLATDENEFGILFPTDFGWVSEYEFAVWISYPFVGAFVVAMHKIFKELNSEHGGIEAKIQEMHLVINLADLINKDELEDVFPRDKYTY